jgi:hypothetical protein
MLLENQPLRLTNNDSGYWIEGKIVRIQQHFDSHYIIVGVLIIAKWAKIIGIGHIHKLANKAEEYLRQAGGLIPSKGVK